ncbi:MAG: DUF6687 family protein [Acidimicrobiales bacterium]
MRRGRTKGEWAGGAITYEPYSLLRGRPHVMVDGAPALGTVLTLSHWPGTPTPVALRADLSAQSALRWRESPGPWAGAGLVSTDHLDQDGLVSLFAVVWPDAARQRAARLVEVARAGDFATFTDRDAARASFALANLADEERSPLPGATLADPAALTTEALGRLCELVDHPERHAEAWAEEDAALAASESAIAEGLIRLEEVIDVDLAIVSVPSDAPTRLATRFMARSDGPCHPAAVHNATTCGRVLYCQGARYELVVRYESWVRLVSRQVAPRVDLGPLASALRAEEVSNLARWSAEPVSTIVQHMSCPGSDLSPSRVCTLVEDHLRRSPPAWFPASEGRPSVPPGQ